MDEGKNTSGYEGEQEFWGDLLAYLEEGRVIPVVGSGLLNLTVSGKAIPLYQAIAEQLLKNNGLSAVVGETPGSSRPEDLSRENVVFLRPNHELNDAVTALARKKGKRIQDLYRPIHDVLKDLLRNISAGEKEEIFSPLRKLASIDPFNLFVTTTFDGLLAEAIDAQRYAGQARTLQVEFAPNLPSDKRRDIPEGLLPRLHAVLYLFGKVSPFPIYAIHEEDVLEFVYNLQAGHSNIPPRFLSEIRSKNLLLIGCNFADWLSRFFLRLSSTARLFGERDKKEFLVCPSASTDQGLTIFLERFSQNTRIYPCSAGEFVCKLSQLWESRKAETASLERKEISFVSRSEGKFSGGIFISYAHEDIAAAGKLFEGLKDLGGDVIWFDKSALKPGDEWKHVIEIAVEHCDLFLPLISETTERRKEGFFRYEWDLATERSKRIMGKRFILPIVVDKLENFELIPPRFKDFHFTHAPGGEIPEELKEQLVAEIRALRRERT